MFLPTPRRKTTERTLIQRAEYGAHVPEHLAQPGLQACSLKVLVLRHQGAQRAQREHRDTDARGRVSVCVLNLTK